jgi:hypothetical protein
MDHELDTLVCDNSNVIARCIKKCVLKYDTCEQLIIDHYNHLKKLQRENPNILDFPKHYEYCETLVRLYEHRYQREFRGEKLEW